MKVIENRDDVYLLVSSFYKAVRKDSLLGPIFNKHIPNKGWPIHLDKLTDFWTTALFGIASFKGNPTKAHIKVDKGLNYTMSELHFKQWLQLWFTTIDALFFGELAQRAKDASMRMASGQYSTVIQKRP